MKLNYILFKYLKKDTSTVENIRNGVHRSSKNEKTPLYRKVHTDKDNYVVNIVEIV